MQSLKPWHQGAKTAFRSRFGSKDVFWGIGRCSRVLFNGILTIPGFPFHFVCEQPVRDVAALILQNQKCFRKIFFNSPIQLIKIYGTSEKTF